MLIEPKNTFKIDSFYAYISVDEEGNEGLCAAPVNGNLIPLVGADLDRMNSLIGIAQNIANQSSQTIKMIKMTSRLDLKTLQKDE